MREFELWGGKRSPDLNPCFSIIFISQVKIPDDSAREFNSSYWPGIS
jgi:hypothetical protein